MELRMDLKLFCSAGTKFGERRNLGFLHTRAGAKKATPCPPSLSRERMCNCSQRGRIQQEKRRVNFGGVREWRRQNLSTAWDSRRSNVVAEAPNSAAHYVDSERGNVAAAENREEQGSGESSGEEEVMEKGYKMSRICDRLIEVFMQERTTPGQWRNLLALSKEWVRIRPHFFKRCKSNAKAEKDPVKRRELVKLARQVKEVDDTMILHDELLVEVEKHPLGIDTVVASRRKDFTGGFFEHLQTLCECSPRASRRDEIASIAGKCLSFIEAHDAALEDSEALTDAQLKFDEILHSPSLEAAADKIEQLGRSKELDSTLLLLITKAWVAANQSTTMTQEVKDIMLYLYNSARRIMQRIVPDEVHIIKHLLSIQDPRERFAALTTAFAPGDDLEDKIENRLHTTPVKLRRWITLLLDAYDSNKQSTVIQDAQTLMNPEVIGRMEMLKEFVDDQFI